MKYKVQNKLECKVKFKDITFEPKEIKFLEEKPYSDKFIVIEEKGEPDSEVSEKVKLNRRKE